MSVRIDVKPAPASLVFTGMAILTSAGIGSQFYLAGMAVFGDGVDWGVHGIVGGVIILPILGMLTQAFMSPRLIAVRELTAVLATSYLLQIAVVVVGREVDMPLVAALHPTNGALMFGISVRLAFRSLR
ncbi:MAG: hypothetical protein DI528_00150 [Shinella sp.]|nr:MAG: hypothetical protein DI528_00150 [Shinella sp.]